MPSYIWELTKEVLLAYTLVASVLLYDRVKGLEIGRELLITSVASLLQLFFIGFVILYLVKLNVVWFNLAAVVVMTFNAALISSRRFKLSAYDKKGVLLFSFLAIALVNYLLLTLYLLVGIVKPKAQMLIPFAGLLLAAGMRSISLFSQYLRDLILRERKILEEFFALGASEGVVGNYLLKKAIPLATVVIRDMLRAAGIVHIPGVMVGLLIAGTPPLKAAALQFLVLASMLFSMFFTPVVFFCLVLKLKGLYLEGENP